MKEFIQVLRRFVPPYKKFLFLSILFNILSAILNVFSFTLIIPILQILFKMTEAHYSYIAWTDPAVGLKDIAINNFYYYITDLINQYGQSTTLLILGIFLAIMTFLKIIFFINKIIQCLSPHLTRYISNLFIYGFSYYFYSG